ncbi:MAG: hypothetical protein ACM3KE_19425 [Hyphomicrobiales bacterium]
MTSLIEAAKLVSVLLGAVILGNWFLSEFKKSRRRNLPWYSAYLSAPGLLILAALLVPVIYWLARR